MRTADDTTALHRSITGAGGIEMRPTRLLVPTVRRSDFFLSHDDTLRAADLGITRHLTDVQLLALVPAAAKYDVFRDDPLAHLIRMRDALSPPRDIAEAREWGLIVPVTEHENAEETSETASKRLGWWWVYDTNRYETREDRMNRYLADQRFIDTKGLARIWCRSYLTTRDVKVATDTARGIIANTPGARDRAVARFRAENPGFQGTDEELVAMLIERAKETEVRGTPRAVAVAGQSDLFMVCDALKKGRTTKKLDEWYTHTRGRPTGRPRGSRTRQWKTVGPSST